MAFPTNPKNELQLDKILNPEALEFLNKKEIFFYSHVNFYIEVLKTLTDFVKNCEKNLLKEKESYKIAGGWWRAGREYENYCFDISDCWGKSEEEVDQCIGKVVAESLKMVLNEEKPPRPENHKFETPNEICAMRRLPLFLQQQVMNGI